jgi:tripartite-type tricarboxylate transporter receptor subunit TctC
MMDSNRRRLLGFAGGAAALSAMKPLYAQDKFPSKPIEVVTHAGVGGGTDITARMMMVHAPGVFKTEFVVVNRVGGSGAAAMQYMMEKPHDGHTIALITQTHLLTILRSKGKFKYEDLVPLARATDDPQILAVGKGSPYKSAKELIGAAKGKALKYGTSLVGGVDHIAVVSIARSAGMQQPTIVPFRGGGDVVINLVGGNIDCALVNYAEAESQFKAGDIRALAVFADKPMAALSGVPTGKEIGVPGSYSTVRGFVTVRGVPEANLKTLEDGLVKAMKGQMFTTYLETSGQSMDSVVGAGPWKAQLDEFMVEGKKTLESLGLLK